MRGCRALLGAVLLAGSLPLGGLEPSTPRQPWLPLRHLGRDTWGEREGLPPGPIRAIAQDRDGALILGTPAGLFRFDGARFEPLARPDGRSSPVVALVPGDDGTIVARGEGAEVLRVDGATRAVAAAAVVAAGSAGALVRTPAGPRWKTDERVTRVVGAQAPGQPVSCLAEGSDGTLYVGTLGGGLLVSKGEGLETLDTSRGLPSDFVFDVAPEPAGGAWIATAEGLLRIGADLTIGRPVRGLPGRVVREVLVDRRGNLWARVYGAGVFRKGKETDAFERLEGAGADAVCLLEDESGNLWVGGNELRRFRETPFHTLRPEDGVPEESRFLAVVPELGGATWLGTPGGGLLRLDGRGARRIGAAEGLPDDAVWCLARGQADELWVGTDRGLARVRGERIDRWDERDGLPGRSVSALAVDDEGAVWAGTFNQGLAVLRGGRISVVSAADGLPSNAIVCLAAAARWAEPTPRAPGGAGGGAPPPNGAARWAEPTPRAPGGAGGGAPPPNGAASSAEPSVAASGGGVWVGTMNGLARVDSRGVSRLPEELRFDGGLVSSLAEDSGGVLWVGSPAGLSLVQGSRRVDLGLPPGASNIAQVLVNGDDVWVVSVGLHRASRARLLDAKAAGASSRERFVALGRYDGLPSDRFVGTLAYAGGRLWIAGVEGVAASATEDPTLPPRAALGPRGLSLSRLLSDSRPVAGPRELGSGDSVDIPAGSRRIELEYSAVYWGDPRRLAFRYRLRGFDRGWVEAGGERVASYTNLAPRSYTFEVEAYSPEGLFEPVRATASLRLLPFFHQTRLFLALCVGAAAGLGALVFRLRVNALEARSALLAERNRIACELHDTLVQGLHGIVWQLEAAGESLKDDPAGAEVHVDKARRLARGNLEEARRSLVGLSPVLRGELHEALAASAQRLSEGSPTAVEVRVEGAPRKLPEDVEGEVLRIGSEALTNALKHARARRVEVVLEYAARGVHLRVRDDGKGLGDPGSEGFGLVSMRERARRLGGRLSVAPAGGGGTEMALFVPVAS